MGRLRLMNSIRHLIADAIDGYSGLFFMDVT